MARKGGNELTGLKGESNWFANLNKDGVNANVNMDVSMDPLEQLKNERGALPRLEVMKGLYFEPWVWDAIEELAAGLPGQGGKSQLVNRVMKMYLESKGYSPKK